jgi:AAA ATPase domain/Bacterial transcriptional activator domain
VPATIVILGHAELLCDGKPAELRRQLRKALALMVAARGRRVRREEIAAAVWDDEDRDVRTLMWSLRRALRDNDSGFDVPPDKGKEGSYRLVVTGAGSLEKSVDAFRFLDLTNQARERWKDGADQAAVELLVTAAGLWGGELFAGLWPDGPPQACRRLAADLEQARDFLVRTLAEAALRRGAPYDAARAYRGRPVGGPGEDPLPDPWEKGAAERGPGRDAAWLAGFLIALHDGPGTQEAERMLAARHGASRGQDRQTSDGAAARADDLLLLAEAGIDVHRPLTAQRRPPVTGSPPVLVGREAELAALTQVLAAVQSGRPAVLAVRGPSGRGKTRLADELAAAAVAAHVPVIRISAAQPGDLAPWQEFAGRLWPAACRNPGTGRDAADRLAQRLTLVQRRALLDFVAPRAASPAPPDPDQAQRLRFSEIAGALRVLARDVAARRGLIVVLDNADRLTARGQELLGLLLAGLRDAPAGIVLLGRDGAGRWTDAVTTARGETAVLRLGPLPERAIGSWLQQVTGRPPTDEEVRQIARATDGEPVRIRDKVAAAALLGGTGPALGAEEGAGEDVAVPSAWLAAAAITAADLVIDTALVASMLELPDEAADRAEQRARRGGQVDTSAGVRFAHGSHRDEVIASLDADPALRRSLHRRAFAALAGRVREGDPDPSLPVRIAGHALGADRDLPAAEAARAFLTAARAERASGEAAETWARAGIARAAPAGDEADPATRACLHLALGDALDQRGAVTAADREYQLAYDIAATQPLERAEALIRLARRWTDPGKIDWYLQHGLRDGIAALADREDHLAVALRLQLTAHLARKSTLAVPVLGSEADSIRRDGVALARAALAQADTLPPAAACEVLNECRWALYDYDSPAEALRLSERVERTSLLARSPYFQSAGLMTTAIDQLRIGRVTEAQGTLLTHERTMPGSHANQWLQLTMETLLDLWHGRFAAAEDRLFTVAAPIVARAHAEQELVADTLQQTWQGQVLWLRRERGEVVRRTDPEVFRQIEGHAFFPIWRVGLALIACDENDMGTAAAHVRALDEEYHGFAAFPPQGWATPVVGMLAEVCLAMSLAGQRTGEDPLGGQLPDIAGRLRAILARHAGEFVLGGWPSVLLGPAERFSGLLALAAGEYEEALQLFGAVTLSVAGAPPQAARLQVDKAGALIGLARAQRAQAQASRATAARLLTEAGGTADRLGMRGLAQAASQLLTEC